ncbi:rRNA maturation RNase YbeY [Aequorivita sp. H23M31]|uniref:Endoribonuclease YbeY n=1 Tax=Aequorivita ciconiae TaxID=2494375 RepID=A0A410G4L4_9FLAO|nr:rRNA maturation RNase YbeY [Aequorivita sp. H23M31]QAA82214.1 rRNA maturation RNase YbeY [Aequorivita sp. H23M31]
MIEFNFESQFELREQLQLIDWISDTIVSEGFQVGELSYVFCDDKFLHKLNVEFLGHDTLTDIISFDYRMGKQVNGEIFISIERVEENAATFGVTFEKELHRVMIHGIFHYCGYKDKSKEDEKLMRSKEDDALERLGFAYFSN